MRMMFFVVFGVFRARSYEKYSEFADFVPVSMTERAQTKKEPPCLPGGS